MQLSANGPALKLLLLDPLVFAIVTPVTDTDEPPAGAVFVSATTSANVVTPVSSVMTRGFGAIVVGERCATPAPVRLTGEVLMVAPDAETVMLPE